MLPVGLRETYGRVRHFLRLESEGHTVVFVRGIKRLSFWNTALLLRGELTGSITPPHTAVGSSLRSEDVQVWIHGNLTREAARPMRFTFGASKQNAKLNSNSPRRS